MNLTTIVILVRHADVDPPSTDQSLLNADGEQRAKDLARVLKDSGIQTVFHTDIIRTLKTANPFIVQNNLPSQQFDRGGNSADKKTNAHKLSEEIKGNQKGKKVLVVGHSETIPLIIQELGGGVITSIQTFDDMFVLTFAKDAQTRVIRMKYGKEEKPT